MLTHIRTVAVCVEDQMRAVDSYTNALGFELRRKEPMGPDAHWIEVAPPGAQSCLVLYPRALMNDWPQKRTSIMFGTPDCVADHRRLVEKGILFSQTPTAMPWGVFATFLDPDGNEFLMTSPVNRSGT